MPEPCGIALDICQPLLLRSVVELAGQRVLELGCGTRSQGQECLDGGCAYTGLDADRASVEVGQRLLPSERFVCGRAEEVDRFQDEPVDLFLSVFGAMQFGDARRVARAARRVAGRDAQFVMSARSPSLHRIDELRDVGRAPVLRNYSTRGLPNRKLQMNITDQRGWAELFEGTGWRTEWARSFGSDRYITDVYLLRAS